MLPTRFVVHFLETWLIMQKNHNYCSARMVFCHLMLRNIIVITIYIMAKNCFFDNNTNDLLKSGPITQYIHNPSQILDDKIIDIDLNNQLQKHISGKTMLGGPNGSFVFSLVNPKGIPSKLRVATCPVCEKCPVASTATNKAIESTATVKAIRQDSLDATSCKDCPVCDKCPVCDNKCKDCPVCDKCPICDNKCKDCPVCDKCPVCDQVTCAVCNDSFYKHIIIGLSIALLIFVILVSVLYFRKPTTESVTGK